MTTRRLARRPWEPPVTEPAAASPDTGFPCAGGHVGPFEPVPEWEGWLGKSWTRCSCGSHINADQAAALSAGKQDLLRPDVTCPRCGARPALRVTREMVQVANALHETVRLATYQCQRRGCGAVYDLPAGAFAGATVPERRRSAYEAFVGPDSKWWISDRLADATAFAVGPFDSEAEALAEIAVAELRAEVPHAA